MTQGRVQSEFQLSQPDGTVKTYTLVSFVTPDDLMLLGAKASAVQIKYGIEYASPSTREARNHLILTRVTNRS